MPALPSSQKVGDWLPATCLLSWIDGLMFKAPSLWAPLDDLVCLPEREGDGIPLYWQSTAVVGLCTFIQQLRHFDRRG